MELRSGVYFTRPPVPGKLLYQHNLVDNGTVVEVNGASVQASVMSPLPATWYNNGPVSVAPTSTWYAGDFNAYLLKPASNLWDWGGTLFGTLNAFKASATREVHSVSIPSFSYAN